MNLSSKKNLILRHEALLARLYRLVGRNRIRVARGNSLDLGHAFMRRCRIRIVGRGNRVVIAPGLTRLTGSSITIIGSGCTVAVGPGSNLNATSLYIEDDGGQIELGRHVTVTGQTELAVIEGRRISLGDDCLLSSQIVFRTGDSHSLLDAATGRRINPSADIVVGRHVWIGHDVKLLKGVELGDHSVVASGAILSAGRYPDHSVVGGVGRGRVLRSGVDWTFRRIATDNE